MNTIILATFALFLAGEPADLVLENANIWSAGREGFAPFAAVRDGRFIHVGEPREDLIGPKTQRIDAGGRVVIPGLIDSHIHMLSGGLLAKQLDLRDAADMKDFLRRVRTYSDSLPPGNWILGGRWSTESWDDPTQPTKEWVDVVSGDHPLLLSRMDGHSALANSAALKLAGITREGPPDPPGGVIDRDPMNNEPTGILRESAMELVKRHIPTPSVEEKVAALHVAAAEATRMGITAVGDICSPEDLPAYEKFAEQNRTVRFFLYITADDWAEAAKQASTFKGSEGWVEVRGLKAYMDGSLGSRTAYMREPFLGNDPSRLNWRGLLMDGVEDGRLLKNLEAARDANLQPIVHAIGDEANHILIKLVDELAGDEAGAYRVRSEHAQHLLPEDYKELDRLGMIASMQPYHKADDGRYAQSYIGPERVKSSYAYRSLLDADVFVAFGSDWPVVTLNPFLGIEVAVTARTLDGKVWQPQESITVAEALECYTLYAAYALFANREIGRIEPGFRADFVLLDRSPFDEVVDWPAIRPHAVYVEGVLVDQKASR